MIYLEIGMAITLFLALTGTAITTIRIIAAKGEVNFSLMMRVMGACGLWGLLLFLDLYYSRMFAIF